MGKKGDLSDFERGMVLGARRAGLSISKTADLLGLSHTTISRVYREWSEKEKISSERPLCGRKCLVDVRGQRRMGRLVRDDRKTTVTQKNHSLQPRYAEYHLWTLSTLKQMGYSSRRSHWVPTIHSGSPKLDNIRLENVAWSDESRFLLQHSDGRVRIWRKEHESMDPSCLVSMVQAGGVIMGGYFLAQFGPLSTNWASFKHHSLPEYYCWPCPSLYDYSVHIFWCLIPAG